ncbi:MAG: NADH-quinone oxidoreductase subunit C, partial [Bacteroidales bacterium]|nr:NADH-quinone oxidoreductase subunit C [Bacteroidales bacterium]
MFQMKDFILNIVPDAVIEEKQKLTVTVEPKKLHPLIKALHGHNELPFDYLVSLIGMDWEDRLGVIYLLSSSKDMSKEIVVITTTEDRENPLLYSITDLYEAAHLNEREVYAMFGIRFINNPDMRRFLLDGDWNGFPLRKDYDDDPKLNPITIANKEITDLAPRIMEDENGNLVESVANIFDENDYIINIGPQHPSTHGVMHFRTALDGEIVKKIDVNSGYIHRGIEKLCESMTYPQSLHLTDRLDYLSAGI